MNIELNSPTRTAHIVLEGVHRALCENPGQKEVIIENALEIFRHIRDELEKGSCDLGEEVQISLMERQIEELRTRNDSRVSDIESIKGNGNCLFLTLAHGLVNLYNSDNQGALLCFLNNKKDEFPALSGKITHLIHLISQGKGDENSENMQYLLRDIACTHNEKQHGHRAEDRDYYRRMRETNEWGTDAELLAFSEVLGVQIALTSNLKDYVILGESGPEIGIRYQNSHFDLVKVRNVYDRDVFASHSKG